MYLKYENKLQEFKDQKIFNTAPANSSNTPTAQSALYESCFTCVARTLNTELLSQQSYLKQFQSNKGACLILRVAPQMHLTHKTSEYFWWNIPIYNYTALFSLILQHRQSTASPALEQIIHSSPIPSGRFLRGFCSSDNRLHCGL